MADPTQTQEITNDFSDLGLVGRPASEFAPEAAVTNDFSDLGLVGKSELKTPGLGGMAGAFASQAVGGAMEMAPAVAGAFGGAALGGMTGPLAPWAIPLGFVGGGVVGYLAGHAGREATLGTVDDLAPELRPYGVAGETFGGTIPWIGGPIALGKAGWSALAGTGTWIGRFIQRTIESAGQAPVRTALTELGVAGSAALAGGASEALLPGQALPRAGAEIAAGLVNPVRRLKTAGEVAWQKGRALTHTLGRTGRNEAATKVLRQVFDAYPGEDPHVIAAMLDTIDVPGLPRLTAAQRTGSKAIASMEAAARQASEKFSFESANLADDGMKTIDGQIRLLRGTGDPGALRLAAETESMQLKALIEANVTMAENRARQAATRIGTASAEQRATLGREAEGIMDETMTLVREAETEVWGAIPREAVTPIDTMLARFGDVRSELLPNETVGEPIAGFMQELAARQSALGKAASLRQSVQSLTPQQLAANPDVATVAADAMARAVALEKKGTTTVGDLLRFRSRALELARQAQGEQRFGDARRLGMMAEAALDDLARAEGPFDPAVLERARNFSRDLNDTFTRTFAGTTLATTRSGAPRVPPELLMRRSFAAGGEVAELHLREIEDATRFLDKHGIDSAVAASNLDTILAGQEGLIRNMAAQAVNPDTGKISRTALQRFLQNNDALLKRFPEVKTSIQEALRSDRALALIERRAKNVTRLAEKSAFLQASGVENPVDHVRTLLSGRRPVGDLKDLASRARRHSPEAVAGLRSAVFDWITGPPSAKFDPSAIRARFLEPIREGAPSAAEILQRAGIVDEAVVDRTKQLLDAADKIIGAGRGPNAPLATDLPDVLTELVARITGARLGAQLGAGTTGGSIQTAGIVSGFFRKIARNVTPAHILQDIFPAAAMDDELLKLLLTQATTPEQELRLTRSLHAYLIRAGLMAAGAPFQPESEPTTGAQP